MTADGNKNSQHAKQKCPHSYLDQNILLNFLYMSSEGHSAREWQTYITKPKLLIFTQTIFKMSQEVLRASATWV